MKEPAKDERREERHGNRRHRDEGREPGASSGREQEARRRVVPGTHSAMEGYSDSATAHGDPLRGLLTDHRGERPARPGNREGDRERNREETPEDGE
jgi:hypothetical protein